VNWPPGHLLPGNKLHQTLPAHRRALPAQPYNAPKLGGFRLAATNLEIGKTVGDYEIIALLGHGGMGKVFKVRNVISDRVDAMKSLLSYGDGESEAAERFLREIKVLAKLEHPNITSFRTAFRLDDELLMIMEYVEGSALSRRLHQKLELWRAVDYACQVLSALSHAHHSGVLHRDVKPSNILIGAGDRVKLTDFGIASLTADPGLTITGGTVGTLYYMAPEQMKALPIDGRADLYSVGVTLYEMITGRVPFKGDSYYSVLKANLEHKPVPANELVPDLPSELCAIIEKSLEKDPDDRFQTADEFRAALQNLHLEKSPDSDSTQSALGVVPPSLPASRTPSRIFEHLDKAALETARKKLAIYIGPMAKIIVGRAANRARSVEDLYQILATEISSPQDREKFLRSRPL
jgi:eukaryotic-like serine/threonine-protein kinase